MLSPSEVPTGAEGHDGGPLVRCAVLGDPVAHSLSPVLHRAAHAALGLAGWRYDAVQVPDGGLAALLDGLDGTWRGLSLTMPLKRQALVAASRPGDRVSERASLAGGANTLVLPAGGGGPRHADNTDLPGAAAAVRERHDGPVVSGTVLGAGATAASTGLALCELGARRVVLLARSPERTAPAAEAVRRHPSAPEVEVRSLDPAAVEGDVVVSTVPVAAQSPALVAAAVERPVVFEVLYDPWPTPLARAAAASGAVLVGGLDLLVHQAALQVTAFTGLPAPLALMRTAGEAALAARTR